ncbi:hypothetical protein GJ688_01915 [Heliobacillus mobilis]|uniref:Uncharacterized protein n=1 Tax=Heliobacterium mobile TaxID=28064 RepID=A0A6I3SBL9_HELMO|nr:hypothetical protein [Heliobacterium mobile]MTV47738.1 hypothetical protein [Heliobacterium mobile]
MGSPGQIEYIRPFVKQAIQEVGRELSLVCERLEELVKPQRLTTITTGDVRRLINEVAA